MAPNLPALWCACRERARARDGHAATLAGAHGSGKETQSADRGMRRGKGGASNRKAELVSRRPPRATSKQRETTRVPRSIPLEHFFFESPGTYLKAWGQGVQMAALGFLACGKTVLNRSAASGCTLNDLALRGKGCSRYRPQRDWCMAVTTSWVSHYLSCYFSFLSPRW